MTAIEAVNALRARLAGEVILPGAPGYDEARRVFNGSFDRYPAAIVRCAETADVAAAVRIARDRGVLVAVRGGGHSFSGLSTCDDGIVIDLSRLKTVSVDPRARTARAGGGVLWGELDAATQAHGLHTPGGRITTTGVGGFTLGGGYGWTSSKFGLACDNLIGAEIVLADGTIVHAGEEEHGDLFWAIRGGGGNFGVVTEFEFRLHPLGPIVLAGLMMFPIERASEVVREWRDCADAAPDELSLACVLITAPPEPFVPPELRGKLVVGMAVLYVGDAEQGAHAVRPLKELQPAVDLVAPVPYTEFQAALDATAPWGLPFYARGEYMRELSDGALDTLLGGAVELLGRVHPLSQVVIFRIGQGVTAIADEATAFSHRDAGYLFHPIIGWTAAHAAEPTIAAVRAYAATLSPCSTGAPYLNFTAEGDRVREAYGEEKYARLVTLKDRYDPGNLFRLNQNIRPSQTPAASALV